MPWKILGTIFSATTVQISASTRLFLPRFSGSTLSVDKPQRVCPTMHRRFACLHGDRNCSKLLGFVWVAWSLADSRRFCTTAEWIKRWTARTDISLATILNVPVTKNRGRRLCSFIGQFPSRFLKHHRGATDWKQKAHSEVVFRCVC